MADLVVTITESVTLNGAARGSSNALTITGVDDVYHRIITCPANQDSTIATFRAASNTSDNALDLDETKYIRVTNLDSSNPINLSLQVSNDEDGVADFSATILVEAGKSFLMGTPHDGIQVSDTNATIITTLVDLESLLVDPGANAVQVEVFIAGVV
jgi:hypothetical protein